MSMPLSARRLAPPANVAPFPDRFVESEVVLSARETAAVSAMLRQAKSAIAALRQRVTDLESERDEAQGRAHAAEERADAETVLAKSLQENLADTLARNEALETDMTAALNEREQRLWSAEARVQELERRATEAEVRAAAAETREWETKARLARAREALGE
jgi:chromosome segregation ATPase